MGGTSPVVQEWVHDRRGLPLQQVTSVGGSTDTLRLQYGPDGQVTRRTRGTCEQVNYALDWAGRPTAITAIPDMACSTTLTLASNIEYKPLGPPTVILRSAFTERAAYDLQYRMTHQEVYAGGSDAVQRSAKPVCVRKGQPVLLDRPARTERHRV